MVDLPEPVEPTTRISPSFSMMTSFRTGGSLSESNVGTSGLTKRITIATVFFWRKMLTRKLPRSPPLGAKFISYLGFEFLDLRLGHQLVADFLDLLRRRAIWLLIGITVPLILIWIGAPAVKNMSEACLSAISLNSGVDEHGGFLVCCGRFPGLVISRTRKLCPLSERLQSMNAQSLRSRSLMLVLARVLASTCLTMTAQYRLHLPSADGSEPETTTDPAGTRP